MSSPPWNTAAYWRELAAQTRKLADTVKDAPAKAMILSAAGEYDQRSEQVERESEATIKGASSPVRTSRPQGDS
jgi:hypothetical protein